MGRGLVKTMKSSDAIRDASNSRDRSNRANSNTTDPLTMKRVHPQNRRPDDRRSGR